MDAWELAARERIRDAVARYCHLVDGGRLDEVLALFTADAVLEAGSLPPAVGHAAIRGVFAGTGARLAAGTARPLIRHHVTSVEIEDVTPDAARVRSYFLAVTERGLDHWGRYRDRFVGRDGAWLIAHRRVRTDGRAAGSVVGE